MSEISRLKWRCRRGMKELDLLLERYLDNHYAEAEASEQQAFQDVLDLQDPQLFDYITERDTPSDPAMAQVIRKLCAFLPDKSR